MGFSERKKFFFFHFQQKKRKKEGTHIETVVEASGENVYIHRNKRSKRELRNTKKKQFVGNDLHKSKSVLLGTVMACDVRI